MSRCRLARRVGWIGLAAAVTVALLAAVAPGGAFALTNFTWSGASTSPNWSSGGNWVGGAAPSGAVGTLTFPTLPSCVAPNTCYFSIDDQTTLSVAGISFDDGVPYHISYTPGSSGISLGSGGLTATPPGASPTGNPSFLVPITLSAPQAWSINKGASGGPLTVGTVTGPQANTLAITFASASIAPAQLHLANDVEVGAVTASGPGVLNLKGSPFSLNGTSGKQVHLSAGATLFAGFAGSSSGPLTSTGGQLQVGQGSSPDGTLAVKGSGDVSLDASTKLSMFIDQPGTAPSTDYSQLTATGTVNLGGATLNLSGSPSTCSLHPGDVDTLITTTGSLSGTFAGIPDGTVIPIFSCSGGSNASVRINYTAHSVTAAVPGGSSGVPVNTSLPTISGTPQLGQTLTEHRGTWTNNPTSYSQKWEDCDAQGTNCSFIADATAQTYTLTSSDVGHTIRVEETAANANGPGSPATSATTGVVSSPPQPPVNISPPTIAGTAQQGQTLTEQRGRWTNNPTSYGVQWEDCADTAGNGCTPIAGATGQTHTLTAADVCHTVAVQETATNAGGTGGPVSSPPTRVVVAPGSDFTWSGASVAPGGDGWSVPGNWAGCKAPSGTVGTLSFPAAACDAAGHCDTADDVAGLVASHLDVATASARVYLLGAAPGVTLTLGSGLSSSGNTAYVAVPIVLGGANTWTIAGSDTEIESVSGPSDPLAIDVSGRLVLNGASFEVGDVTTTGGGEIDLGGGRSNPRPSSDLNGSDGHSVTVSNGRFVGGGTIGPLAVESGATLFPGVPLTAPRYAGGSTELDVHGDFAARAGSTVWFDRTLDSSGSDYRVLVANGSASLGGAHLSVQTDCTVALGTTYTLMRASGGISGTFDVGNGGVMPDQGCSGLYLLIAYTGTTVTAEVVAPPTVQTGSASGITQTTANLSGSVTPNGLQVFACGFDISTTADYSTRINVPCSAVTGAGFSPEAITSFANGLTPGTTYHYRLVASNAAGTTVGEDATFTTFNPTPGPIAVTAVSGSADGSAAVSWTDSAPPGAVTGFNVRVVGAQTPSVTTTAQSATVTGLTDCQPVQFEVQATGPGGDSGWSDPSQYVVPHWTPSGEPNVAVILMEGVESTSPQQTYSPVAGGGGGSEVSSYCSYSDGRVPTSFPDALNRLLTQFNAAVDPTDPVGSSMIDRLASHGRVVFLPWSFTGVFMDSSYRLHVWNSDAGDADQTPIDIDVSTLQTEIASVHSFWPHTHIVVLAHSLGGVIAEQYWEYHYYGKSASERNGVTHLFALDAPLNGTKTIGSCGWYVESPGPCPNFSYNVAHFLASLWTSMDWHDPAISANDTDGAFLPVGTEGDMAYDVPNLGTDPLISQLLFSCKSHWPYPDTCGLISPGLVSPCPSSDHGEVKNCRGVINYVEAAAIPECPCLSARAGAPTAAAVRPRRRAGDRGTARAGIATVGPVDPSGLGNPALHIRVPLDRIVAGFPWALPVKAAVGAKGVLRLQGGDLGTPSGTVTVARRHGGNAAAQITSWSANAITARVPAGATTGRVTVTTAAGRHVPVPGIVVLDGRNGVDRLKAPRRVTVPLDTPLRLRVIARHRGQLAGGKAISVFDGDRVWSSRTNRRGVATFVIRPALTKRLIVSSGTTWRIIAVHWAPPPVASIQLQLSPAHPRSGRRFRLIATVRGVRSRAVHVTVAFGVSSAGSRTRTKNVRTDAHGHASVTFTAPAGSAIATVTSYGATASAEL